MTEDEGKHVSKKEHLEKRIKEIEDAMMRPDFWDDKDKAQREIREMNDLKDALEGVGKYDKKNAVFTIFSGAGGDDAEDFSRMLFDMYQKCAAEKNFGIKILHENQNDHGGYRNISFEVEGKNAYGIFKNESGVHRLVRISPFNAKKLRHTSFSLVEVIPKFDIESDSDIVIPDKDLKVEFSRSSGPGGQNANKRETAVRVVHIPTNLSASAESERSQEQNKAQALSLLKAKIYRRIEENRIEEKEGMYVSKTTEAEWGNQIRSYVLHPYKMVKDHRTGVETHDVDAVLNGGLDAFLEAERNIE
ncbi:MAG TPA: PCRF domain-containing protein [Candidatus Paceibacterota bacterium]|nr:PCRF domain-containing protein [Candidatus Paceibacterota bacterium]